MLAKNIFIYETESVKDALKKLDKIEQDKLLLVTGNGDRLLGTITDGDIRRYILRGKNLESDIKEVYNKNPIYLTKDSFSLAAVKKLLTENKINAVPVLNVDGKVVDFITRSQAFSDTEMPKAVKAKIGVPVVIMAGGKGYRLDPFTRILPKPLIPIGDKPIIEIIIEEFKKYGVDEFYVTLNAKGEMVEAYFRNIEKDYKIHYIWEKKVFLGTAGSLKFLEHKIQDIFIVSNCDVIVKANFEEVINYHKEQNAALTILAAIQHYKIPYGVVKFVDGGCVTDINEKPEYTFPVISGIYILSKQSLEFIPRESPFDMTDLIRILIKNNRKVVIYPVNENDYIDIGQWEEYKKTIDRLKAFS